MPHYSAVLRSVPATSALKQTQLGDHYRIWMAPPAGISGVGAIAGYFYPGDVRTTFMGSHIANVLGVGKKNDIIVTLRHFLTATSGYEVDISIASSSVRVAPGVPTDYIKIAGMVMTDHFTVVNWPKPFTYLTNPPRQLDLTLKHSGCRPWGMQQLVAGVP